MAIGKNCHKCNIILTKENTKIIKSKYYDNSCKKCRNKYNIEYAKLNRSRINKYNRLNSKKNIDIKESICKICDSTYRRKHSMGFCSEVCSFMSRVEKQKDCWIWTGLKNLNGYGRLNFRGQASSIASRVSYILFKGPVEDDKSVCHTCDVRICVNPDHLWIGTPMDNVKDKIKKGKQWSKLTATEVISIRKLFEQGHSRYGLAELFKTSHTNICNIINKRNWKHV